jgi:co-chaperonin GroES (HSP10)
MIPIGQKVVIRQDEASTQTASGLHTITAERPNTGVICAVGQNNPFVEMIVEVGHRVNFNPGYAQRDKDTDLLVVAYKGLNYIITE